MSVVVATLSFGTLLFAQAKTHRVEGRRFASWGLINLAGPDYGHNTLRGFGAYATFDLRYHWGVEASFHQLNDPDGKENIYERTYEIGPRYVLHFGPLAPYAKLMVGRGVIQFPPDPRHSGDGPVANLAYTIWGGGFGADYHLTSSVNLRADYELQQWHSFPPNGLTPRVLSFGVSL
ncbi:outer membrane beta-barrel protein [Edaphobacter aggregans]|uniref:outer membrane beta-barrel protein n=1 Tax=Edaphobacter aggregans TaxID=570835 RepID=UPI00055454F0|nr:outer membrane beta-barrel protein [Edaphobacter aggregans]